MIYLHIGTHKTGTTSLQKFLGDHRDYIRAFGFDFYSGSQPNPNNHTELHFAAMRPGRDSFGRLRFPDLVVDSEYKEKLRNNIGAFIEKNVGVTIFTNEGLSLLRYDDEVSELKNLFEKAKDDIKIILFLRNKNDFLKSYAMQIRNFGGLSPSEDQKSSLYIGRGTWLLDYEALISVYEKGFGRENVIVLDYDREIRKYGDIVASFVNLIGIPKPDSINDRSYRLNIS